MEASLHALLSHAIDDSSLLPPTSLSTEEALRLHAGHREGPAGDLLARLVFPTARLPEIEPHQALLGTGRPWHFEMVGRWANTAGAVGGSLLPQHQQMIEFVRNRYGRAVIDGFDTCLPVTVSPMVLIGSDDPDIFERTSPRAITRNLLVIFEHRLRFGPFAQLPIFAAPEATEDLRELLPPVLEAFRAPEGRLFGLNLAVGGKASDLLAFVIVACRDAGVALKFEGALAPLTGNGTVGFVNLMAAAVLAHARQLSAEALPPILEAESPTAFTFSADQLVCEGQAATTAEIAAARVLLPGFAHGRFADVQAGLRSVGWMA
jgi:hypothetical protein